MRATEAVAVLEGATASPTWVLPDLGAAGANANPHVWIAFALWINA